jgi:glucan phosphoethanolaminetransferase (alkaline phosphatase superfamily)
MNLIIFGIYLLVIIILFSFLGIVLVHLDTFKTYSKALIPVTKIFLLILIVCAILGGYMILTSTDVPTITQKIENVRNIF